MTGPRTVQRIAAWVVASAMSRIPKSRSGRERKYELLRNHQISGNFFIEWSVLLCENN